MPIPPSPGTSGTLDAVVFDLDGTLADSAHDIRLALEAAFREIAVDLADGIDPLIDGSPLEEIFAAAVPGGTTDEMNRFIAAYRVAYARAGSRNTRLYPGVRETLDALAALRPRLRLAVATSKREASANDVLVALGIRDHFAIVAGSGGLPMLPKPAPDLLLAVADLLRVAPARALMVGDTLRDIVSGQRAGMRTAAVTYGLGSPQALIEARPDYVLEEFDEVLAIVGVEG